MTKAYPLEFQENRYLTATEPSDLIPFFATLSHPGYAWHATQAQALMMKND